MAATLRLLPLFSYIQKADIPQGLPGTNGQALLCYACSADLQLLLRGLK
jgi:hypothetical protein